MWLFGDGGATFGATSSGAVGTTYTYQAAGSYTATLTITDATGTAVSAESDVVTVNPVNPPPTPVPSPTPPPVHTYNFLIQMGGGQTWQSSAFVLDTGTVTVTWSTSCGGANNYSISMSGASAITVYSGLIANGSATLNATPGSYVISVNTASAGGCSGAITVQG